MIGYDITIGNLKVNNIPLLTKEYFYRLARNDAIIHACIMNHEHAGLSWEAALAQMVYHLSEQNQKLTRTLNDVVQKTPTPIYLLKD